MADDYSRCVNQLDEDVGRAALRAQEVLSEHEIVKELRRIADSIEKEGL
jgi:hypothetical protein